MNSLKRLISLKNHINKPTLPKCISIPAASYATMATKFDINTSRKMNSGYDIPVLGFGVSGMKEPGRITS